MRVVLVNYAQGARGRSAEAMLDDLRTLTGWAEAVREAGATVEVVQGFEHDATIERRGVRYRLVKGPFAPYLWPWRIPRRLHRAVVRARPDVVHLNSLLYGLQLRDLRRLLPRTTPIVVQHHGEGPRPSNLGRRWQRLLLGAADGFSFSGQDLAAPWQKANVLPRGGAPIASIVEGSSAFGGREVTHPADARRWQGAPLLAWVGNLDTNKDPLTVLEGVEPLLTARPDARLVMAFRHDGLRAAVTAYRARSPALERGVSLVGALPYPEIEGLLSRADVLVQGSHRESCGFAAIDAMACGAVPVVTDIPSFRFLTDGGRVGALWAPGDAQGLHTALQTVLERPLAPQQEAARRRFEEALSWPAIGRQATAFYRAAVTRRSTDRALPSLG